MYISTYTNLMQENTINLLSHVNNFSQRHISQLCVALLRFSVFVNSSSMFKRYDCQESMKDKRS